MEPTSSAASVASTSSHELVDTPVSIGSLPGSRGSPEPSPGTLTPDKPKLPERHAPPAKPIPIPPPKRNVDAGAEASGSHEAQPTGLLATLRTKAADKQALAASVNSARDTMKRWGANWQAARRTGLEGEPGHTAQDSPLQRRTSDTTPPSPTTTTRQRSVSTTGNAFLPSPGLATTGLTSTSPTRAPPSMYGPAASMAIPGIRDPAHRGGMGSETLGSSPSAASSRAAPPALPPRSRDPSPTPTATKPALPPRASSPAAVEQKEDG
jgi:hypothetical protein